ncbi:nitrite reductase large subunit NirB [Pseudalkalibacillus hwajinpoensis]|uniref:nitrite reductase large subunit NirB n=1 Tax=Guptibacillus hwajinpoensis TaxID=208199 RepID=UPI00325A9D90
MKERILVIGNGMAGIRCVEEIVKLEPNAYDITVIGKERTPAYDRIQLSTVLQGNGTVDELLIKPLDWYDEQKVTLRTDEAVTEIDKDQRLVYTNKGGALPYDRLIIATGSNPFIIPFPGIDKKGVITFRDIDDCNAMIESAKTKRKAVVIGGGLLGLEAARGLLNLNMEVSVVHNTDALMDRQLDATASKMLKDELEQQGMTFLMEKETTHVTGDEHVSGLAFKDGEEIEADLVVMAVGIKPNIALASETGLETNRGIVVDDFMKTSHPGIYAVGECAEHRGIAYGLVAPLYEQAAVLAKSISGDESGPYEGSVVFTKLKVSGVDVFSAGLFQEEEGVKAIRIHDESEGIYKKIMIADQKIVGTVMFGDTSDSSRILSYMRSEMNVEKMKKVALLEPEEDGGDDLVASMPESEIVCGCNGVTKGCITKAIQDQGLRTVGEIKGCTNASRSCGGCQPLVSQILEHTLGDVFDASDQQEPICGCTSLSRNEIVEAIREKGIQTTKEVYHVLDFENKEGCSKCRPSLNYYLGMLFPEEYEDEAASRFVNERMHANIQNDGTFSVVPRMYGGVTTSDQLRKIAEVSDKYEIKMLKVTGGQRIDMLGAKKDDLPSIWADLDMPSGYAYGKALRTVKTCVGEQFCRFGTQDSIGLGVRLEKKFERLQTPHKVKMAVSACPRSCAESGFKDVGIIGVDGAWELYVGGNGGINVQGGHLLATVTTDEEVMKTTGAYLQYYRETANYLERTSAWVERVGIDHVKEVLSDEEEKNNLNNRIDIALRATRDPWKEALEDRTVRQQFETILQP